MTEDLETRRKRLQYRASHRGTKELDIILGGFAESRLPHYSSAQLDAFELLLQEEEVHLQSWLMGLSPIPEATNKPLLEEIAKDHALRVAAEKEAQIN